MQYFDVEKEGSMVFKVILEEKEVKGIKDRKQREDWIQEDKERIELEEEIWLPEVITVKGNEIEDALMCMFVQEQKRERTRTNVFYSERYDADETYQLDGTRTL